ncbi:MAG: alpha/beta hydrolase, partial [Burkholderiales bacterium]
MSTEFEFRADVEFAVRGTEKLKGNLWLPKGQGKTPVVIGVHGGGWHTRLPENYQYWGPWLAARGYAVFAPTYRLSSAESKAFPEGFHDVRAAVQWIKGNAASLGLDAERIALMGDSAGG